MNRKPIEEAKLRDLALAQSALMRARRRAEELARAANLPAVQIVDGEIVFVQPGASEEPSSPAALAKAQTKGS